MAQTLEQILVDKSFGKNPYFISDTSAHTGLSTYAVFAIEDTVISAVVTSAKGNSLASETIKAGHWWFFPATSLTLTSGAVWTYNERTVE